MPGKFELRIDKIRLRGPMRRDGGRTAAALQDKYIARSGGGAYMAVASSEEGAIREIVRTMRMHYRRLDAGSASMAGRIIKALETPCERVPNAANDIRYYPVTLLSH